jgi:hypothetical protein
MFITLMMLTASLMAADGGEESVLTAARLQSSDKALLDFFRKRTQPAPPRGVFEQLAKSFASADAAEAEATQRELISFEAYAAPVVRVVANRIDDIRAATRANPVDQNPNVLTTEISASGREVSVTIPPLQMIPCWCQAAVTSAWPLTAERSKSPWSRPDARRRTC